MRKLVALSIMSLLVANAYANEVGSYCYPAADGVNWGCIFQIPVGATTDTYANYYCTVTPSDPDATVTMNDHNVLISGFSDGTVKFGPGGSYTMDKINSVYFQVINDLNHDGQYKAVDILVKDAKVTCANGKKWIITDQSVRDMTLYTNAFHCFYIRPGNYTFNADLNTKSITKPSGFQSHSSLSLLLEPHSVTYIANRLFFNYACANSEECFYTTPIVVNRTVAKNYIGTAMYWARMYNTRSDNIVTYYPITNQSAITGDCPILN